MSIMISPRSQENQYHYQQQNPPPNGQMVQPQYPLYPNIPFQNNNNTPNNNTPNGNINTPGSGQTAGFNLTYNNNYTTTNPLPPSNNSSFSLPSVPQAVYYEHQEGQAGQANVQGQGQAGQGQAANGQGPIYYYQQQYFQPPTHPSQANPMPQAQQQTQGFEIQYPNPNPNPQGQQFHDGQSAPQQIPQQLPQQMIPPPQQLAPPPVTSLPIPATSTTNPGTAEDAPFPGVLDPNYRNNSIGSNHQHYHPRSNTYPLEQHKSISKNSRQSLTSPSLLGMTPETARRNRCTICQKQFKRPSSLQTHMYSHTGEKPFACSWDNCGRLFSVRSNMIRHRKLHERDAKLKNGGGSGILEDDIEEEEINASKQANGNEYNGSLPNLLHPNNNSNHQGDFQLGYFN